MNDCPNVTMREQLPDLLHDRLDASARAAVMAHVGACADCRAELELLRNVREMLVHETPRVDINYVVQALPKPTQRSHAARLEPRRRVWSDWRVAAAVTLLVAGGSSVALIHRNPAVPSVPDSLAAVTSQPGPADVATSGAPASSTAQPTTAAPNSSAPAKAGAAKSGEAIGLSVASTDEVAPGGGYGASARVGDLNERQLKTLLDQIGQLQAVPVTEPEPVTIRVNPSADSPQGGT